VKELIALGKKNAKGMSLESARKLWAHADQVLDCLKYEEVFKYDTSEKTQFQFQHYYDEPFIMELNNLILRVETKFRKF
jgi:serine/threonine-protein kinase ULK/ATG1